MRKLIPLLVLPTALSLAAGAQSNPNSITINNAIQDVAAGSTTGFVNFHAPKENTKGRRMLLADFSPGYVTTTSDSALKDPRLVFNYDKITHDLYYSFDRKTVIEADRSRVKTFHLATADGEQEYTRLDLIKPDAFFQTFNSFDNTHYGFYALTKTEFKKADYRTDGMVESGNNYDEYVDNIQYYIVSPGGKEYQPLELKKKSVRAALPAVKTKVEEYLSQHKNDDVNETFVKNLIEYINKG